MLRSAARLTILVFVLSNGAISPMGIGLMPQTQAKAAESLPGSVTVLGETLVLKDRRGGGPGEKFIAEYIPGDETFENWTLMFASRFVPGAGLDPLAAATATASRISARKQAGDPLANSSVFRSADGKSAVVDFLVSQDHIIEQNVFRYFGTPNGLVSLQLARRIYDDKAEEGEVRAFIKGIGAKRSEIVNELMRADLPVSDGAK